MKEIKVGKFTIGGDSGELFLIAGPCVIESEELVLRLAERIKRIAEELGIFFIFKSSYDKANRSSIKSFRGPGLEKGLKILEKVKKEIGLPVLSDVHRFEEIAPAAEVLDILQVPAFLCRQTDFVLEVAKTGKVVNVKKGQFLAPQDVKNIIEKVVSTGNDKIIITERGITFGYNNLVVDMRSFPIMRGFGYPVVYDATHSVQRPGGLGFASGGDREMIPYLLRAAVACGVDGVFMEVHEEPDCALCDGPNSLRLSDLKQILQNIISINNVVKEFKKC
ncbi:MAG: 3-deoxy-8-phosphooctulonate synthase [bacterium]